MGGGAAIRAAAKAASYGAANTVLRGVSKIPYVDYPIPAIVRKVTKPVPAVVSSSDEVVSLTATAQSSKIDAKEERSYWESKDWEFAGAEEDIALGFEDPIPRLVFGTVPTLNEAKEATAELKDALEQAYNLSSYGSSDSLISEISSKPDCSENKSLIITETGVTSLPKPALQAFKLLSENSAAQSVVASIASDPNVWHAVLENPDLKQYLYSQKTAAAESVVDNESFDEAPESSKPGLFHNIKAKVVDMLNGLSDFFHNIFGGKKGNADVEQSAKTKTSFMESPAAGVSIMGLAIMVVVLILLKRGGK